MYLQNKYSKWYSNIIQNAKSENRKKKNRVDSDFIYYEKHHIIPKSMGGKEEVLLTAKEHYICHLLLPFMLEGQNRFKMINALIRMTFSKSNKQERHTARSFEIVRKLIAEKNSIIFKGKPKSLNMRQKLSKSRLGMKFTEEHKQNLSKNSARQSGPDNPFYNKKHSEETKQRMSENRKGKNKGKKFFTNGVVDKFCFPGEEPKGFVLGITNTRWRNKNA